MKVDVDAVHKRICHLLAVIRTPGETPAFTNIAKAAQVDKERRNQQLVSIGYQWTRLSVTQLTADLR